MYLTEHWKWKMDSYEKTAIKLMNRILHKMDKLMLMVTLCFCVLAMAGCTVGPNYHPQEANVPLAWTDTTALIKGTSAYADLVHWWTGFNDPNLSSLVERAINSNLDLLQVQVRIQQARAARGIAAGGSWPSASATGSYERDGFPDSGGSDTATRNLFQTGLDAVWEIDIFGGVRRSVEAADADVQFAVENHRDVLVTLVSEVALNYIELRGFQQEIVIARNNLAAQQQTAELTRKRFQGGLVGALDVANADAQVATTASQIPQMEAAVQQAIYNLSVLLGLEPTALLKELSPTNSIPATPPEVPIGIPSELLRRRPDIRRAEAKIHGATARIGVATADLYPKFNLTGSVNFQNDQLHGLINWKDRFWTVGPAVDWQIFSAGRVSSNIELQKALQQESVLAYQKTVLTALQDVENALVAYAKEHERRKSLVDAVAANRKAVELATQLYMHGQTNFLNVLDAQRSLFVSEDSLVQSTRNLSTDLVALYKALGGGWGLTNPQNKSAYGG
jgi:NodT family efflux transporter outer membrane factor (OMF) lipoprotein